MKNSEAANSNEEIKKPQYPKNGNLRVYNQFPRRYPEKITQMISQLPEISEMGFNAVWINPVQQVGEKVLYSKSKKYRSGSLYAMSNDCEFNTAFISNGDQLRTWTSEARKNDLIPLFDLVINQIAVDDNAPIYENHKHEQIFEDQAHEQWPDTRKYNYENQKKCDYILDKVLKPFVKRYIVDYGFMGARIDAIKHLSQKKNSRDVLIKLCEYINELCMCKHKTPTVLLGELLLGRDEKLGDFTEGLRQIPLSHLYNGSVWYNFSNIGRSNDELNRQPNHEAGWNKGDSLLGYIGTCAKLLEENPFFSTQMTMTGGTVGYIGNHDSNVLYEFALKSFPKESFPEADQIEMRMREIIFGVAFTSDSGYIALAGDEIGHKKRPLVFEQYEESNPYPWESTEFPSLIPFIKKINTVLNLLPPAGKGYYCKHYVIPGEESLGLVLRVHPNKGNELHIYIAVELNKGNMRSNNVIKDTVRNYLPKNVALWCISNLEDEPIYCDENNLIDSNSNNNNNNNNYNYAQPNSEASFSK